MTSEIIISFDTEDFTSSRSADAIRDTANLLTEEGIRGCYQVVGLLAKQLIAWDRRDVLDALKPHEIDFHTWGHSYHPTLNEYTDVADYAEAYRRVFAQEAEGIGMVKAATGAESVTAACPPGNSVSYASMYAYADLGLPVYCDSPLHSDDGRALWFCNQYHVQYFAAMESMFFDDQYDENALIAAFGNRKRSILYTHPHMVIHPKHWDGVNYFRENQYPFGEWVFPPERSAHDIDRFYNRLRALLRRLKAMKNADGSPRFRFVTLAESEEAARASRTVTGADLLKYRDALKRVPEGKAADVLALSDLPDAPAISYAECLYAVSKILTGSESVCLDGMKFYGFLEAPKGVGTAASLTRDEVMRALKAVDFSTFLRPSYNAGFVKLGPLDLLTAALDVYAGEQTVTVAPKEQQPSLDSFRSLRDLSLADTWVHSPDFRDEYLSDRLRWQAWTMRAEPVA